MHDSLTRDERDHLGRELAYDATVHIDAKGDLLWRFIQRAYDWTSFSGWGLRLATPGPEVQDS